MKHLIPILILFASCTKCYDCTKFERIGTTQAVSNFEQCGTKREIKDYIEQTEGYKSITVDGQTVWVRTDVVCE